MKGLFGACTISHKLIVSVATLTITYPSIFAQGALAVTTIIYISNKWLPFYIRLVKIALGSHFNCFRKK